MFLKDFKILKSHGKQFVPDVTSVTLTPLFRGRPEIEDTITPQEAAWISGICPTGAFKASPIQIDLGRCVFCRECEVGLPGKIRFTNDYKIASNVREDLIIKAGDKNSVQFNENTIRPEIGKIFKKSLKLRQVSAGGDNSCEMELNAASNVNFDMGRFGIEWVASPRHADGIVITGPVTKNMSSALEICYNAIPDPKIIILVGTDSISGGIFSNSNAIDRSFIDNHFIDLYVPGNPAHPLTFINGLLNLIGRFR